MRTADLPPPGPLRLEHDRRRFVDVEIRVDGALVPLERERGDVHADRRIAGRRRVDRHARVVRRRQQRLLSDAERALALAHVLAAEIVELGARHGALKLRTLNDRPKKGVRREQHVVVEKDVVDPDDAFVTQHDVGLLRIPAVHREAEAEVRVVIEIRARGDDPVDVPALDERNERRHSKPGRRERAGERHADGHVRLEHFSGEELTRFAQPRRVVGEERVVDQIRGRLRPADRRRFDARTAKVLALLVRLVLRARALALFGGRFLRALGAGGGWFAIGMLRHVVSVRFGLPTPESRRGRLLEGRP